MTPQKKTAPSTATSPPKARHRITQINAKTIWLLVRDTFDAWLNDKAPTLGAALSYYTIFALAPLLIIVIAVASLGFGREAAQGQIIAQIEDLVGENGAKAVQAMLESAREPQTGMVASIIGVITLIVGSTGVFVQLQDSLNTI